MREMGSASFVALDRLITVIGIVNDAVQGQSLGEFYGGKVTKGAKVRARKRFKDNGGGLYRTFPNGKFPHSKPRYNTIAEPDKEPEVISRQQLRAMLRKKAKNDIILQYGRMGAENGLFVGYLDFSRRGRRRVMLKMQARWYAQIKANLAEKKAPQHRGIIKSLLQKLSGAKPNTLKASGVTA